MKYKASIVFLILSLVFLFLQNSFLITHAFLLDGESSDSYIIFNEDGEEVCEKSGVEKGDTFITKDFYEYEIYEIDGNKAFAKKTRKIDVPEIKRENIKIQKGNACKKICLYMTHNDESYIPSDGYDSIYGPGGIHDVAKKFKEELEKKNISIILDETLHIPHDSSAYTRSAVTSKKLLNENNPDAMFDIHRDGVSKSFYYIQDNNQDFSKIRIVVGKSNPNFNQNYEFAKQMFSIGNSMYPWLFSDIYCGKGHYNQALQSTDLLFEMGTYLIEKDYVYNSLPYLADVVDAALYASYVDEKGDITVDDSIPETNNSPIIEENKEEPTTETPTQKFNILPLIIISLFMIILFVISIVLYKKHKKQKAGK